jgi:hypothetical protein
MDPAANLRREAACRSKNFSDPVLARFSSQAEKDAILGGNARRLLKLRARIDGSGGASRRFNVVILNY